MELELLLSFLGASILLTLMPGPDNIFVLTESLSKGRRDGALIALGLALGVLVHTSLAATGLSIIVQRSALAFTVVKYMGALYLFYLAFMATREQRTEIDLAPADSAKRLDGFALIRKGFLMNILNPKVALFFIAFLPQFISKTGFNVTLQMFIMGIVFALQAFAIFYLIALMAGRLTRYLSGDRFWKITKWSKVAVLTLLGLALVFSK